MMANWETGLQTSRQLNELSDLQCHLIKWLFTLGIRHPDLSGICLCEHNDTVLTD